MDTSAVRDGNAAKRAAIISAARTLFLRDGVDRVSMDAVAALAQVSKRTVYDYFGDKKNLHLSAVTATAAAVFESLQDSLREHLSDEPRVATVDDLEAALREFAIAIGITVTGSDDYANLFALTRGEYGGADPLAGHPLREAPEEALAERLAHFGDRGLLELDDARLAADHFTALTLLLLLNAYPDPARRDLADVRRIVAAGTHAFVRAYGART